MKTIGLVGGTSWVSTVDYYKYINQAINEKLGKYNSGKIILNSINFQDAINKSSRKDFDGMVALLQNAAKGVSEAGADCVLLCANTIHRYADKVIEVINVPLIHIAEETAKKILQKGYHTVGLLGTSATMEQEFYKDILLKHGIKTIVPEEDDRRFINRIIFKELSMHEFKPETRLRLLRIIGELHKEGAEGVIMGCTEIPLIINQDDCDIPLFDTLQIHAQAAVDFALKS